MREEIIDPHYWDELLPGIVDVESGHGSSFLDPIIIPTFGDKERVLGCIGDCSEFDGDIENANFKFCLLSEDTFSVCTHCGLHFFCASNESINILGYPVQGDQGYEMMKKVTGEKSKNENFISDDFIEARRVLTKQYEKTLSEIEIKEKEKIEEEDEQLKEEGQKLIDALKSELFTINNAKEFLGKIERKETTMLDEYIKDLDESKERFDKIKNETEEDNHQKQQKHH